MKQNIFFISFIISIVIGVSAHASSGGILNGYHLTKVCHSADCTTPMPGILNFRPTGATAVVVDDVLGLSGDVWGNELGWISLNPTGQGLSIDATTGEISGKAWSQVSGWINFSPTGQGVTVDIATGEFSGWAWTGGPYGGWIKFDCGNSATCIKTDWRGIVSPSGGGGGSSGGSGSVPTSDVCPNIIGVQSVLPLGYAIDNVGQCVLYIDVCPNLEGQQSVVPTGFTTNSFGACVPFVDFCTNLRGTQSAIPYGYILTTTGICIAEQKDSCPDDPGIQESVALCKAQDVCVNMAGIQSKVPVGFVAEGELCYPTIFDMCNNIEGQQLFVPEEMVVSSEGDCRTVSFDVCGNLAGVQDSVPPGFYEQEQGVCLFGKVEQKEINTIGMREVVSFSFVPKTLQFPIDDALLSGIVEALNFNKTDTFSVDMTSTIISAGLLLFALYLVIRVIRAMLP